MIRKKIKDFIEIKIETGYKFNKEIDNSKE